MVLRKALLAALQLVGIDPRGAVTRGVQYSASRRVPRRILNTAYRAFSTKQKQSFHRHFAGVFNEYAGPFDDGLWQVWFCGRLIRIPLKKVSAWVDWEIALSVLGHDPECKLVYKRLVESGKPRLMLDIGASYGTHCLLFLAHGIPTVAFEPNPHCQAFIRTICAVNAFDGIVEPVAVGATAGVASLCFLPRETWLGTTDPALKDRLGANAESIDVPVIKIDDYVGRRGLRPDVMKIDTEGSELDILNGAIGTLTEHRPLVLFEAWDDARVRAGLFGFFREHGYKICDVSRSLSLDSARFLDSGDCNFLAVPDKGSGATISVAKLASAPQAPASIDLQL